ncbi:MAG: hypothetical protein WA130_16900 [Candidatus Methanoperedens sp.]
MGSPQQPSPVYPFTNLSRLHRVSVDIFQQFIFVGLLLLNQLWCYRLEQFFSDWHETCPNAPVILFHEVGLQPGQSWKKQISLNRTVYSDGRRPGKINP